MKIRIVATPPGSGGDPEFYRRQWVGVELEVGSAQRDLELGWVYLVNGESALRALAKNGAEAYAASVWYRDHRPWRLTTGFELPVICCEEVKPP